MTPFPKVIFHLTIFEISVRPMCEDNTELEMCYALAVNFDLKGSLEVFAKIGLSFRSFLTLARCTFRTEFSNLTTREWFEFTEPKI